MPFVEHRFYFYVYDGSSQGGKITTADMLFVGSCRIGSNGSEAKFADVSREFNSRLRAFLIGRRILQFIPLHGPTKETDADGVVSICYYQSKPSYDIVYEGYPGHIMLPAPPLMERFDELYDAHGLDGWDDPRSNTTVESPREESAAAAQASPCPAADAKKD